MNKNTQSNENTSAAGEGSKNIMGDVDAINPIAENMEKVNIDNLNLVGKDRRNRDPNLTGEGSEQNLRRDVEGAVTDVSAMSSVVPGSAYGKPADQILLLQDYFRKPVLIGSFSWTTATTVTSISPYALWESLAVINSKFGYFNKRSYNLVVSFSLAASPYHIGCAVVDWNPSSRGPTTTLTNGIGYQRRHVILTPDQSYWELAIPHFDSAPYVLGSASSGTSRGTLSFSPQFALARVDGSAPGTITVTIRAWTEDMVLSEPSFTQTMLKSKIGREYQPLINQGFDTARNVINAADSVADLFGFCVENKTESNSMVMRNTGSLANADGSRVSDVLTLSQKNFIEPIDVGSALQDELTIASLTSRRGLVRRIDTYTTTSATNDVLVNIPVTPFLALASTAPCPMAYISNLFNYWTGSIAFTITVYSSPLQQGAILIAHEPSTATLPTNANNTQAAATARSCILDLSTSKKKTIYVSATGQTNEILLVGEQAPTSTSRPTRDFVTGTTVVAGSFAGYLTLSVNKPLIAPGASSCYITVEAAAGPDFQLLDYYPEHADNFNYTMLSVKSANFQKDEEICDLRQKNYSDIRQKHTGEKVVSMRAALQRMSLHGTSLLCQKGAAVTTSTLYTTLNVGKFIAVKNRLIPAPSNQVQDAYYMDPFSYISALFARCSGGYRVIVRVSYRTTTPSPQFMTINRCDGNFVPTSYQCYYANSVTRSMNTIAGEVISGASYPSSYAQQLSNWQTRNGSAVTDCRTNPFVSIEETPVSQAVYMADNVVFNVRLEFRDVYATETYFNIYRCSKEDTQFYEFVGCPTCSTASPLTYTFTTASADGTIV